jgi:hypothetical protein
MNVKQATVKFFRQHPRQSPIIRRVCHKRRVPVHATEFVCVTDLVPKHWQEFYAVISTNAPFSWGDNNRSMVTAEVFADHCERYGADEVGTTEGAYREWLKKVRRLGDMYVDLEN